MNLNDRIDAIAQDVVRREAGHSEAIAQAREKAQQLHSQVSGVIGRLNQTVVESVPYFRIEVSEPRTDDKHLHAVEFGLERGRHRAVITVKSKGEVTLVGPFRTGKKEGPCRSFPVESSEEIEDALGDFLERFVQEAASP